MTEVLRTIVTIVLFFGILGILVLVHELGHFLVARLFRVRVLEFAIGFPPRVRVLRDVGETVYTLNALPIGGYVKLEGEDGDDADDPRSFASQGLGRQLTILLAGVVMNVFLAGAIFTGITLFGDPAAGIHIPVVEPGGPAAAAGIQADDVLIRVDGVETSYFDERTVLDELRLRAGEPVSIDLLRDGSVMTVYATLRTPAEVAQGKGALGVRGTTTDPLRRVLSGRTIQYGLGTAVGLGVERTVGAMGIIVDGVGQLVSAIVTRPTEPPPAAGPVGIATQIGDVFWSLGPLVTLYLAGILSANLAVVNILPFPPLDGGRMLILVLKRVLGGRLSMRAERLTYVVGFGILMIFLVWVTGFDIARGLSGG